MSQTISAREVWNILVEVVGVDSAVRILNRLAGRQAYFPSVESLLRQVQKADIIALWVSGKRAGEIAIINNLSVTEIKKVINRHCDQEKELQQESRKAAQGRQVDEWTDLGLSGDEDQYEEE